MRSSSSSSTTRLTLAGWSALTTKVAVSGDQGMMSIFSPCISCTTAWTRLPFMPTHAPTGSIDESWLMRSEEHTPELQSLMRISYDVFCLQQTTRHNNRDLCHIMATQH